MHGRYGWVQLPARQTGQTHAMVCIMAHFYPDTVTRVTRVTRVMRFRS